MSDSVGDGLAGDRDSITVIKPQTGWRAADFPEIWRFRELFFALAGRDIKVRYKQTVLGFAWAVIQPLTTMVILSFIFGRLAGIPSDGFPYPVFVFSGLLAWMFFSAAVSSSSGSLLNAGGMITKIYFPRILLPAAGIATSVVDFGISLILLLVIMGFYGMAPGPGFLLLPLFFIGLLLLAFGVGAWLSAVTVAYRDFRYVVPFMLQIWMYLTPVIYPLGFIPEQYRWLVYLNPLSGWVGGIRSSILGREIDLVSVSSSALLTLIIVGIGFYYFEKAERRFADII